MNIQDLVFLVLSQNTELFKKQFLGPIFLHFHEVFLEKNCQNNRVEPVPWGLAPPPQENPESVTEFRRNLNAPCAFFSKTISSKTNLDWSTVTCNILKNKTIFSSRKKKIYKGFGATNLHNYCR